MMAPAPMPCPACGLPSPEGTATCPRDGTPLRAVASLASAHPDDGSPRPLFVWLFVVGTAMFVLSGGLALWLDQASIKANEETPSLHPPPAFNSAILLTRIERMEEDLREAAAVGNAHVDAANELKVLRVRAETASDPDDQRRVTDALDAWEARYLPR